MSDHRAGEPDDDMMYDEFDAVAGLLTEITDADRHRLEPPPSVWNAIAATVSADRGGNHDHPLTLTEVGNGSATVLADVTPIERQATTTMALAGRRRAVDQPAFPPEMSAWRRQWLPVAAAVAVTIVGGLVTWAFSDDLGGADDSEAATLDGEVVAVTRMTNDGLGDGSTAVGDIGEARLVRSGDRYFVDVDLADDTIDPPAADGYYELWVVEDGNDGVVSLGVLTGDGRHALPPGIDATEYPVVDISIEPIDGDPTHSGVSAWRGHLDL